MVIHELKILPEDFNAILKNEKRAELRNNDRNFQVGDILCLREYISTSGKMTGQWIMVTVTHILDARQETGLSLGYVILSIEPVWIRGSAFDTPRVNQ